MYPAYECPSQRPPHCAKSMLLNSWRSFASSVVISNRRVSFPMVSCDCSVRSASRNYP